jgi:integrase
VGRAVEDWLLYGLSGRDANTVKKETILCRTHVIPALGARKLRDLSADDVDKWLASKSTALSTRSLQAIHSCLNRAIRRAMARDKVKRNVADLCSIPQGRPGRPSKSLTFVQAEAVLGIAEESRMAAYVVLSLLTGARTEELRALTWDHVFLNGDPNASPPVPPHIAVWRSVRTGGDTKTRKSRRTLALPRRCIDALHRQRAAQEVERRAAGEGWREHGLVFASKVGTPLDPSHVRRDFRGAITGAEGIDPEEWTPRELRHSFVSLLSDRGVPLEEISRLVGHSSTAVTEEVYRMQIRPVAQTGAVAMDDIFGQGAREADRGESTQEAPGPDDGPSAAA